MSDFIKENKMPVVWQISSLSLDNLTLISGVILKKTPFFPAKESGYLKNFLKALQSYFIHPYTNKEIAVITDNNTVKTKTDKYGSFKITIDGDIETENLQIRIANNDKTLKILQSYPVFFPQKNSPIDIISDIDDTIVVSYTKNMLKRIKTIAFTSYEKRKPIGFTQNLFKEFEKQGARVLYISKSESNLFAVLSSIIQHNKLPAGNLILTHYLKFRQLFNPKKGRDYKLNHIRFILKNTKTKKYILLGDDSQKDMEVYSDIVEEFPGRILKVYIRKTRRKLKKKYQNMWDNLESTGIAVDYFDDDMELDPQVEYEHLINNLS